MNSLERYIITAVIIIFISAKANCQIDTCWTMYFSYEPENSYNNPDSVLYDSYYLTRYGWY